MSVILPVGKQYIFSYGMMWQEPKNPPASWMEKGNSALINTTFFFGPNHNCGLMELMMPNCWYTTLLGFNLIITNVQDTDS